MIKQLSIPQIVAELTGIEFGDDEETVCEALQTFHRLVHRWGGCTARDYLLASAAREAWEKIEIKLKGERSDDT